MPDAQRPKLVLIDGHALAYKMFYARMPDFSTRSGEPTKATSGFTRTILSLINAPHPPDYLAVSFDTGATFRDALFADYKGTREKMPDDLSLQIDRIQQILRAFNIPLLMIDGYEADDVLGTVARRADSMGLNVEIITGDRDLLQLVTDHVLVQLPGNKPGESQTFDPAGVREKYGVTPSQIVDLKALIGDTSDNIPGVAGIGDKTASKLLQQYGTLDEIYAHLGDIAENRARTALENGRDSAYLSYKLATIITDAPVDFDLEACRIQGYDREPVIRLFQELEFRTMLKQIAGGDAPSAAPPVDGQQLSLFGDSSPAPLPAVKIADISVTHIVQDEKALDDLIGKLEKTAMIAFDTETTGTNQMEAELVGISLSVQEGEAYYIPVGHDPALGPQIPLARVIERLRPALTDPDIPKAGHNIKYDAVMLSRNGLEVAPLSFDTMIGEWLVRPDTSRGKLGLKGQAFIRLGLEMTEIEALIGKGKTQRTMAQVPIEDAARYAAADADVTLRLVGLVKKDLAEAGLNDLFHDIEMPLVPVLAAMEQAGALVDVGFLNNMSAEIAVTLSQLIAKIYEVVGYEFNINSTQQLSQALFERLKLPTQGMRKTSSGHYSTAVDVLDALRAHDTNGVIEALLQYRELEKLRSTYLDALPAMVNPRTGRIHTSFNQTGAITGRISSSDPNVQNIPIRTEIGRRVRDAFIAAPGHRLIVADYSQIELRILAHVSNDDALRQAFLEDQDVHATTAAAVYGVPLEAVTREQRRFAKAVNFGLMYGMSAYGLADRSELTLAEAENFVKAYFERFPQVKQYLERSKQQARDVGYVETLLKRRRHFPALQSKDATADAERKRRDAEREAVNTPIQGTAADIIKIAMINLHRTLQERGLRARMILQVHDELIVEAPENEAEQAAGMVKDIMESAYPLSVPLRVDAHIAQNWGEAK